MWPPNTGLCMDLKLKRERKTKIKSGEENFRLLKEGERRGESLRGRYWRRLIWELKMCRMMEATSN